MFRCAYCGAPLDKFGDTKALIAFAHIKCPNCGAKIKVLRDIEED